MPGQSLEEYWSVTLSDELDVFTWFPPEPKDDEEDEEPKPKKPEGGEDDEDGDEDEEVGACLFVTTCGSTCNNFKANEGKQLLLDERKSCNVPFYRVSFPRIKPFLQIKEFYG